VLDCCTCTFLFVCLFVCFLTKIDSFLLEGNNREYVMILVNFLLFYTDYNVKIKARVLLYDFITVRSYMNKPINKIYF
jgi:hypothetical protein